MRKLVSKDVIEAFESMPERAKAMALTLLFDDAPQLREAIEESALCQSPIEEILYMALDIMLTVRADEFTSEWVDGAPAGYMLTTYPQYEIELDEHTYYADFLIEAIHNETNKEMCLVVECDGHEFHHATKEQVQHDNEREYNLKMAGFDVLRFSGSQIFNQPTKCANDILDYIAAKVGPNEE